MQISKETKIIDVINNPSFKEFGRFIFPLEERFPNDKDTIDNLISLLPFHNHINLNSTMESINYMTDKVGSGEKIFYDYYTQEEKFQEPSKNNTGLFFFRGEPNSSFAVISAGGAFNYVGSIHEGFPYALEIIKKGYNAFVLQYRTGDEMTATEDLAAAISFIFRNAETFGIGKNSYSLWGSSAGARMAAHIGSYGTGAYGGDNLPKPCAVIMPYTGHSEISEEETPAFAVVGEDDNIVSPSAMRDRIENLKACGVDTEFHLYPNLAHGFGLGIGTTAEGWVDLAIKFWEKQMK